MTTAVSSSEEDEPFQTVIADFLERGPMRRFRHSREPRLTAGVCTSDEEKEDTGQFSSPFLLPFFRTNSTELFSAEKPQCDDSDSSSDRFKGQTWRVEYEFYTDQRMYLDTQEIVDEIYKFAESYMHDSGTRQDADFVGKPDDLYLWRYSGGSKRASTYFCPFSITCDCDAGIRVSEFKTKILLESTGTHDKESHRLRVMHAGCSARGVGGFKADLSDNSSDSDDSADDSCVLACYDSRMFTVHSRFSAQAINAVLRACCAPVGKRRLWLSILCGLLFRIAQF
jgi:hypothetical protein